jgi:AraC family transcriptional regulator
MLRFLAGADRGMVTKPIRTPDYSVERHDIGPASLPAMYHNLHVVAVCLEETLVVRGTASRGTLFARGDCAIRPAGQSASIQWPGGARMLYVHLHPRLIRRSFRATGVIPDAGLALRPHVRDPILRDLGLSLAALLSTSAATDARIAHDLVTALAVHVADRYGERAGESPRVGRLSIETVMDVFRESAVDWAGVSELARRAGHTRSHFSVAVRALTGLSPYAMVLGSRIEAARHLLEQPELSLSEVAFATGFSDQSHLTRVFRRSVGSTPAQFRARANGAGR